MPDSSDALPRTNAVIEQGLRDGIHVGAQWCVLQNGQIVADDAMGLARPGVAMTTDSMMIWLSSSKPITAIAIAQLWHAGRLELDEQIATYLPEFGVNGKEAITIRHALTHTGGFRGIASRYDNVPWVDAIKAVCDVRIEPNWVPGEKAGYHIASSWYVLGEIVQRLSGRPFSQYVREEIFLPLGMVDSWIGMPADTYEAYGDRLGVMHQAAVVVQSGGDAAGPLQPLRPHPSLDSLGATESPRPGSNGRGPMHDLARFYQALLDAMAGRPASADRIHLSPETVESFTTRRRVGLFDHTFRLTIDWGLGFICNTPGDDMQKFAYGFGPHASLRAFGHGGNQSSLTMADPEHGLVVSIVFNGMPGEAAHAARMQAVMTAIYKDLHSVT